MKKLSIFAALAATLVLASCEDDKTPVMDAANITDKADAFEVNEPAFAANSLNLAEGGQFTLQVQEQPNYGAATSVVYSFYVALDSECLNPESKKFMTDVVELVPTSSTTDRTMVFSQNDFANALCSLNGFTNEANYDETVAEAGQKVYGLVGATLKNIPSSVCYSNLLTFNNVTFYPAFKNPQVIWVVGSFVQPKSWSVDVAGLGVWDQVVDGDNTNIYATIAPVEAGDLSWRFYTELTGSWGSDGELPSIGSGPEDFTSVNLSVPQAGSPIFSEAVPGKGNWDLLRWPGGNLRLELDLTTNPWKLEVAQAVDVIYFLTDWEQVYIYGDDNTTGAFPGTLMRKSFDGMWWWEIPTDGDNNKLAAPAEVVFSDGNGNQVGPFSYKNFASYDQSGEVVNEE